VAIVAEKKYAGSRGRAAENFALWTKCAFLRIIYSLSIGCIKTPWGDAHRFDTVFNTFIVDERSVFCLWIIIMLSRFEVMRFRLTASRRKVGEI